MEQDRCSDLRSHFPAFVAAELPPDLRLRIKEHLSEVCGSCGLEIEELHQAFQRVPLAEGPRPLPAGSVEVLAQKIGSLTQQTREVPIVFRETHERKLAWTLVFMSVLALIFVGFWAQRVDRRLAGSEEAAARAQDQVLRERQQHKSTQERVQQQISQVRAVLDPRIPVHQLQPVHDEPGRVRAFVDRSGKRVVVTLADLSSSGTDHLYAVWWQGPNASQDQEGPNPWILLGRIDEQLEASGGVRSYALPESASSLEGLRITLEPEGSELQEQRGAPVFEVRQGPPGRD